MALKIFWTDTAKYQLEDIFNYYKTKVSIKIAGKIVRKIVDATLILEKSPNAGQKELLLLNRTNNYRYLVEGNYKIIYWHDGTLIKIASVFDCRQNPSKLEQV